MFADNVCHNPDMLNASLAIIEAKIEKVPLTPMSTKPIKFVLTCRHLLNPKIGEMGLDLEGRAIGPHQGHSASRGLQKHHRPGKGAQPVLGGAI